MKPSNDPVMTNEGYMKAVHEDDELVKAVHEDDECVKAVHKDRRVKM